MPASHKRHGLRPGNLSKEIAREAGALGAGAARAAGSATSTAAHATQVLFTEPFWQAQAAIVGALILYLTLPGKYTVGPDWLMPSLELLLVGGLWLDRPRHGRSEAQRERRIVLVLLAFVAIANFASLELLIHTLLHGGKAGGRPLLLSAVVIWLTNVAVFALWYWQLDRGGPDRRARGLDAAPDLFFVQDGEPALANGGAWRPAFVDYLYTSFTCATAFSPTDTMPVSSRAKLLFMGESIVSLLTLLLVAARAVNILQ
jgi:uncharacterized membrane protein